MTTSFAAPASQRPGSGPLYAFFSNDTDIGLISSAGARGIRNQVTQLSYPDREQPKPWTSSDWRPFANQEALPAASPRYASLTSATFTRLRGFVFVRERGESKVELDKRYRFVTELNVGVRLLFEFLGVAGGSLVTPGFEIYDLEDRPGAWTTVWAKDFNEEWSLRVSNPYFESWADLSVQLVPYAKRLGESNFQRLIVSIKGHGNFSLPAGSELDWLNDGEGTPAGPSHVRAAEGTYVVEPGS